MTSLNPVYTIGNQIEEVLKLHVNMKGKEAHDRAVELLSLVGINEPEKRVKQYPHELSGGMRQRVMIAIALACEPKLLIADEPTTALDVTIQAQILELMQELKKKLGMGIILITHDLGVVASMCDHIAVMYAGEIVESGPVEEVLSHPRHPYTQGLLKAVPALDAPMDAPLADIPGTVPPPNAWPSGCAFHPRCPFATEICSRVAPPKRCVGAVRFTCHHGD
jgi:oligopeptide transport system ATP-binding protein